MERKIVYRAQGTCSRAITLTGRDGVLEEVSFEGGCHGNLQGISRLVKGMSYEEVIDRLRGIRCGQRGTSCPDQLSLAVEALRRMEREERPADGEPVTGSPLW